MKKTAYLLIGALVLMLSSCQSTKVEQIEPTILPLDFSIDGGKTLDSYWESYFNTKDTYYLDQILAYTAAEDEMINGLNELYSEGDLNDDWVSYLDLNNSDGKLYSKYDMDFLTIYCLKQGDEDTANNMKLLYSCFPQDLLIRNSVKSSAYWSLASNAEQMEDVKKYLVEKLPDLSLKSIRTFRQFFGVRYTEPCVLEVEVSNMCDSNGFGANGIYYLHEDGTWEKIWHQRSKNSKGQIFVVDVIESKGNYKGDPATDISLELTVTHERYWQELDREIESLGEKGKKHFYNEDFTPLPELDSPRIETLEY